MELTRGSQKSGDAGLLPLKMGACLIPEKHAALPPQRADLVVLGQTVGA